MTPPRCARYRRLEGESRDRSLTQAEVGFLESHRSQCSRCRTLAQGVVALNMLREVAIDVEPSESLNRRIIRRARSERARDSLRFWSPAIAGAAIGVALVLGALQLLAAPASTPSVRPFGEARKANSAFPAIPELDSKTP